MKIWNVDLFSFFDFDFDFDVGDLVLLGDRKTVEVARSARFPKEQIHRGYVYTFISSEALSQAQRAPHATMAARDPKV